MPIKHRREDFGGPHFCLSLELGFAGHDEQVAAALSAFWKCAGVEGPWAEPGDIGRSEGHGLASDSNIQPASYGLITNEMATSPIPFALHPIREKRARLSEPHPNSQVASALVVEIC